MKTLEELEKSLVKRGDKKMLYDKSKLKAIRLLVFTDKTKKEIARDLDITEQTLYNWLKDRDFNNLLNSESKIYFSYIRKKTFKKLNSLLIKACEVIENSLNSKDEKLRVKSAFDIMSMYASFKELNLLDIRSLNELSEFLEDTDFSPPYFSEAQREKDLQKVIKAQEFLKNTDFTELMSFEDEVKTEAKTDIETEKEAVKTGEK
jgi:DNA-binding XRE family transcriptional regulator